MTELHGQPGSGAPVQLELRARIGTWWQLIENCRRCGRFALTDRIEAGAPPDLYDGPYDREVVVALSPLDATTVRQTPPWSGRYRVLA